MREKLFDSEAKVMEIIWARGAISAKEISLIAADTIGWNKNTTYTVIKKLETKGFIRRRTRIHLHSDGYSGGNAKKGGGIPAQQGFRRFAQSTVFSFVGG